MTTAGKKEKMDPQSLKVQVRELVVEVSSSSFFFFFPCLTDSDEAADSHSFHSPPSSAPTWTPFTKRRGFLLLGLFLQH